MDEMMTQVTLATIGDGAAMDLFARELVGVLKNIEDPSTEATAIREITIKVLLKPNEDRASAQVLIKVAAKLTAAAPGGGMIHLGRDKGKPIAITYDPRQGSMFEDARRPSVVDLPAPPAG